MTERLDLETNGQSCSSLLESIILNLDPNNNTALVIDDEIGIRKMIARSLVTFAPDLQIYEAGNGKGPCDGVGGAIKKKADNIVKSGKIIGNCAPDYIIGR